MNILRVEHSVTHFFQISRKTAVECGAYGGGERGVQGFGGETGGKEITGET